MQESDAAGAPEIVTESSVNSCRSLFVPNAHVLGYTPGASSLLTPGYWRLRKDDRQRTIKDHQESVKMCEPWKDLNLFAMRLAVMEKTARSIGALTFVWATVVVYAVSLKEIDFWFVTVILVTWGVRIFVRSHELLEWQHQDSGGNTLSRAFRKGSDALYRSGRVVRAAISDLVAPGGGRRSLDRSHHDAVGVESYHYPVDLDPIKCQGKKSTPLMYLATLFQAKNISAVLHSMPLISAVLSIVLSVLRIVSRKFSLSNETGRGTNPTSGLLVFYSLAVIEALIFLFEWIYWQYQISVKDTLANAIKLSQLPSHEESQYTVRRFFYDVYSTCLTRSVVEGLKMGMLDYTLSWLQSNTPSEQLAGVRALLSSTTCKNKTFCAVALKTIGTRQTAVERLIEMITWKSTLNEQEIRLAAAIILCNLVKFNRNSIRVAAIPGSLDAVVSLIAKDKSETEKEAGGAHESVRRATLQPKSLPAYALGLRILINLAKNPMNCSKIVETRGLLTTLFALIYADNPALRKYDVETETPKDSILCLSLRLLGRLASAAGVPGKALREEIAKVVVSISSLRGVLNLRCDGSSDVLLLQQLVTEIISSLAMDENVSEVIGRTGAVLGRLFELFRCYTGNGDKREVKVAVAAGEALKMLVLKDERNCVRIFQLELVQRIDEARTDAVEELLKMLDDRAKGHLAMGILTRFCKVTSNDCADLKTRIAARTLQVMEVLMEERDARQEAAMGLAAATVPLLNKQELERVFCLSQRLTKKGIVLRLRAVLQQNLDPSTRFPCLRRYCLELVLALINTDSTGFIPNLLAHQFRYLLCQLAATTSDLENYSTFSGDIGVALHNVLIEDLLNETIAKLHLQ